jgi:hypothetical protein
MSQDNSLEVVFALTLIGGGLIIDGWKRMRLRRLVQDMPTSPIRTAPQGFVEVQGVAHPFNGQTFTGLQGIQLLYAEYRAQRYIRPERKSSWETKYECTIGERFLLQDQSGWAHVLMKEAELQLEEATYPWDSLGVNAQTQFMETVFPRMKARGGNETIGDGEWRIIERSIQVGEPVYVLGSLKTRQTEPEYKVQVSAGESVRIVPVGGIMKSGMQPLVVADCHQSELLERIGQWGLMRMIAGAACVAGAAFALVTGW